MIADIEEMDLVIGQFLDFARGENEEKLEGDAGALLHDLAEHYSRLGKKVALKPIPDLPPVRFAPKALRRAIANLIDNALRYAGEPLDIEIRFSENKIIIDVLDHGPGIPPDQTERMKRPFTRMEGARSGAGGSGLGLAIVERIARAHGGTLDLLPREGGGLRARLTIKK
jgi:two-component system osmolarity sensor histidine kinase EnvZ